MKKLIIADRDHNERIGIQWLVSSYSLPFDKIFLVENVEDLVMTLENELPEFVIIELDMIPSNQWARFKKLVQRYSKQIIVTTTERTFERAMQAVEIQATNLLVKPHSPEFIRKTLLQSLNIQSTMVKEGATSKDTLLNIVSYQSLFMEEAPKDKPYQLCILQMENKNSILLLRNFLEEYEFSIRPVILPLTDIIVCVFEDENLNIRQELNLLLLNWNERYEEPLAIVLHSLSDESLSLRQMYIQARHALELTFYKGYRQIISIDEEWKWGRVEPFLSPTEQRDWIEMLHNNNHEQLKTWMYHEFLNINEPYPEPGLIRTRLTSILAQIRRFMKTYKLDQGLYEKHYHQVFETILYSPVLHRIVQEILLFTYQLLEGVLRHQESSKMDVIERGIQYVETHFRDKTLSLQNVAEFVERSPAYFSHLLVKKHGLSLSQLITNSRVKEAKKLLLETQLNIQEIAAESGFANGNYFSRIFKEQTGMTPSDFRKRGFKTNSVR
ncbi:DNA-binding response regulator [Cytobacillus suaedae]|nr:DNA-binding response regulator [Cytobacillus suaedae]